MQTLGVVLVAMFVVGSNVQGGPEGMVNGTYQDEQGNDLHGMAQIIIAKHRKGATGDVLLSFRGEYTRFENREEGFIAPLPPTEGGEIHGSKMNTGDLPPMPGFDPTMGFPPPTAGGDAPF